MTTFIDTVLSPFVWFMTEWSLRWLVVAALPILWLTLRPPRDARLRYQICLATLVAGLLLPVLPRWGGLVSAQPIHAIEQAAATEADLPAEVASTAVVPAQQSPEPALAIAKEDIRSLEPITEEKPPVPEPIVWRPILIRGVIFAAAAAWLVGVLILLARWIAGSVYLRHLRLSALEADAATTELFDSCQRELQVPRPVRLAFHADVASPLLLGPWRPTILLPCSWRSLSPILQRASLLHELAHVRRRDDWSALALRVANLALYAHPCYRWLRNRLECEREICCDDLTLSAGVDAGSYAQMLRDFASQPNRFRSTSPAIPIGHPSTVKVRIQHILEKNMLPKTSSVRWLWFAFAMLAAFSIGIGSLRIHASTTPIEFPITSAQDQTKKEVEQPVIPLVPKESLMFGGKSFQQWQAIARADLKPEVRTEAFQALSTLGKNGFGDEATRAIMEIAKTYNPAAKDRDDRQVIKAASKEIRRLGPAAFPALEQELRKGKTNGRRFAALTFREMNELAKPVVPTLVGALKDEDSYVRRQSALSLAKCSALKGPAGLKDLQEVVASIVEAGNSPPSGYRLQDAYDALDELTRQGEVAHAVLPDLVRLLATKKRTGFQDDLQQRIVAAARKIGGNSKAMLPVYEYQIVNDVRYPEGALDKLAAFGPVARSAAPLLVRKYRQTGSQDGKHLYVDALFKIDAEPKDLVPVLKDYLDRSKAFSKGGEFSSPLTTEDFKRYREYLEKHAPESAKPPAGKSSTTLDPRVWSVPGTLVRMQLEDSSGKKFYRLTPDNLKETRVICVAEPRIDLDPHVNRHVRLYGEWSYHRDLKQNFLKVSEVSENFD